MLAVVGANGAGKSTLLRVMGLLQVVDRGVIEFPGLAARYRDPLSLRRRIATVFQQPLLVDDSVYGNVALGLRLRSRRQGGGPTPGHAVAGALGHRPFG